MGTTTNIRQPQGMKNARRLSALIGVVRAIHALPFRTRPDQRTIGNDYCFLLILRYSSALSNLLLTRASAPVTIGTSISAPISQI